MDNTKKDTGWFKGIAVCLMLGCLAAGSSAELSICLFVLAAGFDFYGQSKENENLTALISKSIFSIYIRYWPVLAIAFLTAFVLKKPLAEHFVADSLYCFLGLRFTFCAQWRFLPAFVLVLASAPMLLKICERENALVSVDALLLALFSVFTYFFLPKIMNTGLFSALNASVLWQGLYTALELLPVFAVGFLLAKNGVRLNRKKDTGFLAGLSRGLGYIGDAWLSIWLISSLSCEMLGKAFFPPRFSAVIFVLLLAVSTLGAKLLEGAERKILRWLR